MTAAPQILLIDDDASIRVLVRESLKGLCEVVEASTGEEGIALAVKLRPSMLITDVMMPGLSGFDVVMKLRQIDHLRRIPFIVITSYGRSKEEQESMAKTLGFDDYILKPINVAAFRERVRAYLASGLKPSVEEPLPSSLREYSLDLIDRLHASVEELRNEKKFTESIIQSLSSGLMVLDLAGRIIAINPEGRRILGLFPAKAEGRLLSDIIGQERALLMSDMLKNTLFLRNEMTLGAETGSEKIIGFTTVHRVNTAGEVVGIIVSFRDITELRRIQKEMEKMDRLGTIAEIASAVAHEIRNPLAGIKTMAQSIDENLDDRDENKEYIVRIIRQVDRLNEILKAFFTYARPPKPRIAKTSLPAIVNEVKPLISSRLHERGVRLSERYDDGLPQVVADPNQVQQVFLNLMLNAVDAVPGGGGRVEIEARRLSPETRADYLPLFPALKERRPFILVEVRDSGIGMAKEVAAKIFEPFFTTKTSGSGLGLSIVHRILQENGAAIFVDSREGAGTTFRILFPAEEQWERSSS